MPNFSYTNLGYCCQTLSLGPASSPLLNLSSSLLDLTLKFGDLLKSLLLLFLFLLLLHNGATDGLTLELLRSSLGDVTGSVVAEELLETDLNDPASCVVYDHDGGHVRLELLREGDELHALVDVGEELESTGESETRNTDDTVEHTLVLRERLTEGTALVVDGKGGDLLDKLEEVDSGVEERGREFSLKINIIGATSIAKAGDVDQGGNVNSELSQNGTDDVNVEDVGLRTFLAKTFDDTSARDAEEANRHEHTTDGVLRVTKLDTLKGKNLVHLDGGDESATTLTDDVGHRNDVSQLRSKGSSDGGITKLQSRWLVISQLSLHHTRSKLVGKSSGLLLSISLTVVRACIHKSLSTGRSDSFVAVVTLRLGVFLGSHALLRSLTLNSLLELRVLGSRGVQMGNHGRNRGGRLVETLHEVNLLLIHLLHLGVAGVLGDTGEILGGSVQQGDTDVSLLQSTNIVGTVTSHQSVVTHILKAEENIFLLFGGNTSVDPGVAKNVVPSNLSLELGKSITSDADILGTNDLGIDVLGGINLDADLVIDTSPDKLVTIGVIFRSIEDEDLTVDNLDFTGNMDSGKRVISSNHDNTVAALVQHLNSLLGIVLERAVQDEETSECQLRLDLLTLEIVNLARAKLGVDSELLVSESQNTRTLASKVLVGLFVVLGNNLEHLLNGLGRTLDTSESTLDLASSLDIVSVNHGDGALTLESRRELESALDLDGTVGCTGLVGAHESIVTAKSPSERGKSSLFHRVTDNITLVKLNKGMRGGENQLGFQRGVSNSSHGGVGAVCLLGVLDFVFVSKSQSCDTLNDEILTSQSTSLVKASHIDTASVGNSEGLSTEDSQLSQSSQTSVNGETQFHRQLRRDNTGNNQDTVKHKLGTLAILANTLVPNIPSGSNGEDQEEKNEEQSLGVVGRNSLSRVDHGSDKVTLRSLETGLHDDGHSTVIGGSRNTRGKLGLLLVRVSVSDLEDLGTTPEEGILVETLRIQGNVGRTKLNGILEERSTLTGKHSLVDNSGTLNQKHITSDTTVLLGSVDGNEIARNELVTLNLSPLAQTENPHIVRLDAHATELIESALTLPDDGALENDEHKEGEERIVPILIEHPKSNTEDLKDEEWCNGVLLEQFGKGGNGDIEGVGAIVLLNARQLGLGLVTLRGLEVTDGRLGLGINIVLESVECLGIGIVKEASLLEKERGVELATSLS
ncbi:hypothetical protein HG531_007278 [Fusarium graminearum]|nr:hypothetical protein HG531_007278 [Fusarium graminearum]